MKKKQGQLVFVCCEFAIKNDCFSKFSIKKVVGSEEAKDRFLNGKNNGHRVVQPMRIEK